MGKQGKVGESSFIIRLFDLLYISENSKNKASINDGFDINANQFFKVILDSLKQSPKTRKELQKITNYQSIDKFITAVINPLLSAGKIIRVGNSKSPTSYYKIND